MSHGGAFTEDEIGRHVKRIFTTPGPPPKPNVWCYFCGYPLGIRPGRGPRGESAALPFVFVRIRAGLATTAIGRDEPEYMFDVMQHCWELPDGTTVMATYTERSTDCVHGIYERLIQQLEGGQSSVDVGLISAELLAIYQQLKQERGGVPETPEVRNEFLGELNERRGTFERPNPVWENLQMPTGVLLQRPPSDEDSRIDAKRSWDELHYRMGVVRLLPWKKITRVNYTADGRRYRVYKLGEPYSIMPYAIGYRGVDGVTRYRMLSLPRDAAPLACGTYVRCPKCGGVSPLE